MKEETTSSAMDDGQIMTNATPVRATLWAFVIAVVLLGTLVLPAEYGIDVTGAGRLLGLTTMGERKMAAANVTSTTNTAPPVPTIVTNNSTAAVQYSTISNLPLRFEEIDV